MTTTTTRIHAPAGEYVLTNGASSISFRTRHMYGLGPVKGRLSVRSGNLHLAEGIAGSAVTRLSTPRASRPAIPCATFMSAPACSSA